MTTQIKENADVASMRNVLTEYENMTRETDELKERIELLEQENAILKDDVKDLAVFKPLLDPVPINLFNIQVKDANLMRMFLARLVTLYGRKFKPDSNDTDSVRRARQMMGTVIMAMMRYFTDMSSNSKWNDLVARYLSMPEGR
jgi:hypothetical protein